MRLRFQHNSCPVARLGSNIISCYYFFRITVVRDELAMISFPIAFFLLSSFLLLCSLSAVSKFLLCVYHFPHSSATISRSLLIQSLITISVFLASISPPLSGHLFSLSIFHLPFFPNDQPMNSSPISS